MVKPGLEELRKVPKDSEFLCQHVNVDVILKERWFRRVFRDYLI